MFFTPKEFAKKPVMTTRLSRREYFQMRHDEAVKNGLNGKAEYYSKRIKQLDEARKEALSMREVARKVALEILEHSMDVGKFVSVHDFYGVELAAKANGYNYEDFRFEVGIVFHDLYNKGHKLFSK